MKKKTTKSSSNVFVDLGFDPAEATVLLIRADLMSDLRLYIKKHKLTRLMQPSVLALHNPASLTSCVANRTSSALKC